MINNKISKNNKQYLLGGWVMPKTPLFKPLIASSLALALGVSVAVATDPKITYDNDGSNGKTPIATDSSWNWKDNATSTGGSGSFFTPLQSSDSSIIANLSFVFNKLTDPSNTPIQTITSSNSVNTLTIKADGDVSGNSAVLTFSNTSTGKGLLLGTGTADVNRGTLTFDFLGSDQTSNANWNDSDGTHTRKMVLNLTDTTSYTPTGGEAQNVSLIGNLSIKAGMGILTANSNTTVRPDRYTLTSTNTFEATLGGDMIGNITINPSDFKDDRYKKPNGTSSYSPQTGYRDIVSTFTFTSGSLQGNILGNTGVNTFNFNGANSSITGSITAGNGMGVSSWGAGSENDFMGGINYINFSPTSSSANTITGNILATNSGQNFITFGANTTGKILGNITSGVINEKSSNVNHNNTIIFNGTSGTIGNGTHSIAISNPSSASGRKKFSNNTIVFNADSNTLSLDSLSAQGDYGVDKLNKATFNLISFNKGTGTSSINTISSSMGRNIIGKNLYTTNNSGQNTYNSNLFTKETLTGFSSGGVQYTVQGYITKDNFVSEFAKSDYSANGDFTFGTTNGSNAISAGQSGANYINASGTIAIKGNILSQGGGNANGHNNLIILTGTSVALGASDNAISVKIENENTGAMRYSNNTLLLGATTNTLNLSTLSVVGNYSNNIPMKQVTFNAISLNNTSDSGSKTINSMSVSNGSNIIGKDLITQSDGYNSTLFSDYSGSTKLADNFATAFMTNAYTAKGSIAIGTNNTQDAIIANSGGNYINMENIAIVGNVKASGGSNYIYAGATTGVNSIAGNISTSGGSNNIILKGATNNITANISTSGGSNTITFQGTSSNVISGDISANSGVNTIIANASLTIDSSQISTNIEGNGSKNLFDLSGTTTFTKNVAITAGQKLDYYVSGEQKNILRFQGNVVFNGSNSISELSTSMSWEMRDSNNGIGRIYNVLSFDGNGNSSVTIGDINKQSTITSNGGIAGSNYIGKAITKGGRNSLALMDNFASSWSTSDHQANIALNVTGVIFSNTNNAGNYINVKSITANTITAEGGSNNIAFGADSQVSGNISKSNGGANNFTFTADSGTLTLKGNTNQISTLTAISGNATNKDTLILDTTNNANATSIDKVVNGANLIASMKGDATNSATLTLNNSSTDSTIKTLNLTETASGVDKNILNLQARTTTILDEVNIASGKGLTINLNGSSTTLELDNGLSNSGNAKISFEGGNGVFDSVIDTSGSGATTTINIANNQVGTITGDIAQDNGGANNVVFGDTTKLALQGSNNALSLVDSTSAGTLSLDSNSASTTTIAQLKGSNLTANFGGTDKATKLVIADSDSSNKQIALAGVTLEAGSTNNTLDLTSLSSATISNPVSVDSGKGLTIALGSTDMTFAQGLSGSSVLSVSGTSSFTTTTGDIEASSLNLVGNTSAKATFKNTTTTLTTLNANAKGGNTLALDATNNGVAVTLNNALNGVLSVELNGSASNSTTLTLNGGVIQDIKTTNGGSNNKVIFSSGNNTINNAIDSNSVANGKTLSLQVGNGATLYSRGNLDNSNGGTLNLTLTNSTLSLGGENNKISSLVASGNTLVDLARVDSEGNALTRAGRAMKTLEIGVNSGSGFKGDATFEVYVGGGQADKVIFSAVEQNNGGKSNATLVASGNLYSILNGGGTLLASVADTQKTNIEVIGGERLIGGVVVKTELEEKAENGNTNYYLKQGEDLGAPIQYQEVASSALTVNYDLFLANFNSLNKRMGELRDDANSNGVWARVFGGAMSNDFGAGSKTEYITAQAGYDYSLSVGSDARNHIGIAVAYGTSNTQGNTLSMNGLLGSSGSISLNEVDSHMVEVGIYNTFISDSGWYNDTIFKFDYIMSKFSLSNKTDLFTDTSNFAMVLSDEFGYRYKFGENEKGSWHIDPQLELAFGYFNQSDFNRAMYDTAGLYQSTMQATQDTILTLRTRVGASLGKKFNTEKGFASLYVGAFYEYDYINGGNASVQGRIGGTTTNLDSLESNGRAILNVGSNIELTKGARLYIDVEKSFGDKQRTFMQFNLGARYSF